MDGLIFLSFLFPVSISSSAWTWFIPPLLLSGCLYLFFFVRLPLTALVCEDSGGRRMDVKVKVSQRKISFQTSKLQTELYSICVSKISTSQNDPCTDIYKKKKKNPFLGTNLPWTTPYGAVSFISERGLQCLAPPPKKNTIAAGSEC